MVKTSSTSVSRKRSIAKNLVKTVKSAVKLSYAPYSSISVGAALYCANGNIYSGSNIENSSYSLTMCAERTAVFKAITEGDKKFQLLLIYSPQIDFITPCGACLQVLSEFAPDIVIATMNKDKEFKFFPINTLFPKQFTFKPRKS